MSNRPRFRPKSRPRQRPPKVRSFQRIHIGRASVIAGKMVPSYRPGIHRTGKKELPASTPRGLGERRRA
jgi:hypothetical protein